MDREPEVGDVVNGTVVRVENYGLFIEALGHEILILLPDLSWERVAHPQDDHGVGDAVEAVVVHKAEGTIRASIKHLHPERDPWVDPSAYAVGTVHRGETVRQMEYGTFVQLPAGEWGLLKDQQLELGLTLTTRVIEVNPDRKTILLETLSEADDLA